MHVKVHRFSTVDYAGDFAGAKVLVLQRFCRGSAAEVQSFVEVLRCLVSAY